MRRLNADAITALLLIVGAAGLFRLTYDFRVPIFATMSSALWPRLILAALAVMSLIYLVQSLRSPADRDDDTAPSTLRRHRNAITCFVLFAAFLVTLPWLGMLIGGIVYVFVMQELLGPRGWRHRVGHVLLAVGSVGGMWLVFRYALHVILPEGELVRF
ncbi:MAG: tripartite tricarboxylate transporter TctB family protein [Alphaproteobacteria bacterium]|nr:tripartite tricarboxylate transporter TctB family protein [Alphaproteobacteria bacterium]